MKTAANPDANPSPTHRNYDDGDKDDNYIDYRVDFARICVPVLYG